MRVHISLPVRDLDASEAFYARLFGTPASRVRQDYLNFRLNEPPIHLALVQSEHAAAHPAQHYGVELPDQESLVEWEARLNTNGDAINVEAEPGAQCCYAQADKLWLTDPDGHRWEVWHRTGDFDSLAPPESGCCRSEL